MFRIFVLGFEKMRMFAASALALFATTTVSANLIPNAGFETGFVDNPTGFGVGLADIPDPWAATQFNDHPSTSSPDTHANDGVGGIDVNQTFFSFGDRPYFENTAFEGNRFVSAVDRPDLFEPFGVVLPHRLSPVQNYTLRAQIIAGQSFSDSSPFNTSFEGGFEVLLSENGTMAKAESIAFLPFTGTEYDEWSFSSAKFQSPFRSLQLGTLILAPRYTGNDPANSQVQFGIDALELRLVPEPTTGALLALGALIATRRRRGY